MLVIVLVLQREICAQLDTGIVRNGWHAKAVQPASFVHSQRRKTAFAAHRRTALCRLRIPGRLSCPSLAILFLKERFVRILLLVVEAIDTWRRFRSLIPILQYLSLGDK